jgi:RimJ/RimL family protein N-acetyltransferase
MISAMSDPDVHLRPFREPDLELLERFATDPAFAAPYEWGGFRSPEGFRRRWESDGFLEEEPRYLVVAGAQDEALGWVMWEHPYRGIGGKNVWVIGILLAPEHRTKGVGTAAQQILTQHLFDTTTAQRLCAFTEVANLAEQRALEKCGFQREGTLREAGFRGGEWRDVLAYGLLRRDSRAPGVS